MDWKELSWDQGCPGAGSSPRASVKHKAAHWPGCGGGQMRRGIHVCSTNLFRERNGEAGGPASAEAGKGREGRDARAPGGLWPGTAMQMIPAML